MLVAHSMGSRRGQQNFPFGYIPGEIHGLGLPDFMTPGPPPGQPLLSENDTQNLDSFLNGFDAGDQSKDGSAQQFHSNMDTNHEWMMPPTFVGSETSLRPRHGTDWANFQMSDFTFANDMNSNPMNQQMEFHNGMHAHNYATNGQYDHNLLNQLHTAAQTVQPPFAPGWQQGFQPQHLSQAPQGQGPRPVMRFGSDSHFQPGGYAPPEGHFDHHTTPNLDWLEAQSSAPNTQPNTEPNTQPSSPNWPKKRKLEDYQADNRRNGFNPVINGHSVRTQPTPPGSTSNQHKKSFHGQEQPPTPSSRTQMNFAADDENAVDDEDADFDEDEDHNSHTRSVSPSSSKTKVGRTNARPARARKKSTASVTPNKAKTKPARGSIGAASSARVPLTADQKKANHTNSEQRRRDATARAYAELYDLVPELEVKGKQSTMKKLEIVVDKVSRVRNRVRQLRQALGFDIETGEPLHQGSGHAHLAAGSTRNMGGTLPSDMSWTH